MNGFRIMLVRRVKLGYQKQEINWFRATWQIIGVLLVLTAVLAVFLPVFNTHPYSHTSSCLSHTKQQIISAIIYQADNDDAFPPHFTFDSEQEQDRYMASVMPYLKNKDLFLCPKLEQNIKEKGASPEPEGKAGKMTYVHCLSLRGVIPDFHKGKRFLLVDSTFKEPEKTPYMRDVIQGFGIDPTTKKNGFLSAHGASFAVSYLDGHAKMRTPIDEFTEL